MKLELNQKIEEVGEDIFIIKSNSCILDNKKYLFIGSNKLMW